MSWGSDGTCCRGALKLQSGGWDTQGPLVSATVMMATGPLLLGGYLFSMTWCLTAADAVKMQPAVGIPNRREPFSLWKTELRSFPILSWALSASKGSTVGFRPSESVRSGHSGVRGCVPLRGVGVDKAHDVPSAVCDPMVGCLPLTAQLM